MTTYSNRVAPSSTYNNRVAINSTWSGITRLGGSYLKDVSWDYILTSLGERIIVIAANGDIPLNIWSNRVIPA